MRSEKILSKEEEKKYLQGRGREANQVEKDECFFFIWGKRTRGLNKQRPNRGE